MAFVSVFMTSSHTFTRGTWPCLFRRFHYCPNGEVGGNGISCVISHLKSLHLRTDERRAVLRETISVDHRLFMSVTTSLKAFGQ